MKNSEVKYYITTESFTFDNVVLNVVNTKFGIVRQLSILDGEKVLNEEEPTVYKINFNDSDRSSANKSQLKKLALDILKSLNEEPATSDEQSNDIFSLEYNEPTKNNVYGYIGNSGVIKIFYEDGSLEVVTSFWNVYTNNPQQSRTFETYGHFIEFLEDLDKDDRSYWDFYYEEELTDEPIGKAIIKRSKKKVKRVLFEE